ncbi:hypothetical protein MXEN_14171 [Mycobacterium xenopi RIVM700367]|nr:hypothetical protein MXEN_14171 [Mycobacterium xenopi RIVM700367]
MRSSSREEIVEKFDALEAALDAVLELSCDALTTPERFALERCERVRRRLPAVEHPLINEIGRQASAEELGGKFSHALAEWVLVSRTEAARRIRQAADLGPRTALTGEPLPPLLAATAAAQRAGKIGAEHVTVNSPVLPAAAQLGRPADPPARRSPIGPPGIPVSPGPTGQARRLH